jgi:hypothetical protein
MAQRERRVCAGWIHGRMETNVIPDPPDIELGMMMTTPFLVRLE